MTVGMTGRPRRSRDFAVAVCLQVTVVGGVFAVYADATDRGPSDLLGGLVLCSAGLLGAWFFWRKDV
jgi:hypothetical protein